MQLTNINEIRRLFEKCGFSFSKSLGQNFLINPTVCPRIAELGGCGDDIYALEIGTGVGVLTRELALRCKKVVAVEIDTRLKPILDETLADLDNVEVVFGDVMETDLSELIKEKFGSELKSREVVICANLPYYITSPVIMKVLESRLGIKAMTVMVQREAADRICAKPGTRECGALTYAVNYYSVPRLLFKVNRGSFMPAPNVDSAVIRLDINQTADLSENEERLLFKIIRAGFSQRRKQLVNPLSSALGMDKAEVARSLSEIGVSPTARAEELTLEDYIKLAQYYSL